MAERLRHNFPQEVRYLVKDQQRRRCADCGSHCGGSHTLRFEVHHVVPQALGGSTERANAVGLCHLCHERHDREAICNGKLFYQVLMEEGRWYEVSRLADLAGIPALLLESPKALKRHLTRPPEPHIVQQQIADSVPFQSPVFYDEEPLEEWGNVEKTGKRYRAR